MGKFQTKQPAAADLRSKSTPSSVTATPAPSGNSNIKEVKPTRDQIQRRAYELYCQRTARGEKGTPETDWLAAERELAKKA